MSSVGHNLYGRTDAQILFFSWAAGGLKAWQAGKKFNCHAAKRTFLWGLIDMILH